MVMQLRIRNSDGSNLTVLEGASNKTLIETLNSGDETISFEIARNDPKAYLLNPELGGYAMIWECWDTEKNTKLNEGPITTISDSSGGITWKITGNGRSAYLSDIIDSKKTFYMPIDKLIDDLRFENVAIEPRTSTLVHDFDANNPNEDTFFADPDTAGNSMYLNISRYSKDFVIDDDTGYFPFNKQEPSRSPYKTTSFWAGIDDEDSIVVDLGAEYPITKARVLFPWWGGASRWYDRTYQFNLAYASEGTTLSGVQGRSSSAFTTIYTRPDPNRLVTWPTNPMEFYLGSQYSNAGYGPNQYYVDTGSEGPRNIRYFRVNITRANAWAQLPAPYNSVASIYDYQCDPNYVAGTNTNVALVTRTATGVMAGKTYGEQVLDPSNDCLAAVAEIGLYKELVKKDKISALALQKIDNNNMQISYSHTVDAGETISTKDAFRKFEPGTFFRNFTVNFSGATSVFTKFYDPDCTNCYDPFSFAVLDHNNNMVYSTMDASGTVSLEAGIFTKSAIMRGTGSAYVTQVDAWKGQQDVLSYNGFYSYSETTNDWFKVHFKGESLKWFGTIPAGKTGATVKIELRSKTTTWSGWTTLETSYKIPDGPFNAELIYEIPYGSATLQSGTVYELRVTNSDGNYCSIDSVEGYWESSFTFYNEDSTRIQVSDESKFYQIYNGRFYGGSAYKWNTNESLSITFEGDRLVIIGAKGRNFGTIRLTMTKTANGEFGNYGLNLSDTSDRVFIPSGPYGTSNLTFGYIDINTDTGKVGNESPQHILFDSNDFFSTGLEWSLYKVDLQTVATAPYLAIDANNKDNFIYRCSNCAGTVGTISTPRYLYIDAIGVHEKLGISVTFDNKNHIEQISSIAQALQTEWQVTSAGLRFEPRIGTDTNYIVREGDNTFVGYDITYDINNIASILISYGTDVDGIPLYTLTEDKKNTQILGRTVMRQQDFRNIGAYEPLIGLSRTELRKRRIPERRITVSHIATTLPLGRGDSFILYTKKLGQIRVRINRISRAESNAGTQFTLECVTWPSMS